jgi:putative ATP-binding cassette transporter
MIFFNAQRVLFMPSSLKNKKLSKDDAREAWGLFNDYFLKSKERYKALLLLLGVTVGVCSLVALSVLFSLWGVGFWAALTAMNVPLFFQSMLILTGLITAYTGVSSLKEYGQQVLSTRWRNWLTQHLINKYLGCEKNNYLELSRHPSQIDNPEQRIQEDVNDFVNQTLSLGFNLLNSTLTLVYFIGSLWVLSSTITVVILGASLTIPGLLVWVALLFAGVSSMITHKIGRSLAKTAHDQAGCEADFRQNVSKINREAESIAQERGEAYYKQSLSSKFKAIMNNSKMLIQVQAKLTAFRSFYQQISGVFPYIMASPLYFSGVIGLGQLMQVGYSFSTVQMSLDWFVNSYEVIAKYKASLMRLVALNKALKKDGLNTTARNISVEKGTSDELVVRNLSMSYPSSTRHILQQLNLTFKAHEHVLIRAPSGSGKSTLFKVLSGAWTYGKGHVLLPHAGLVCVLPQEPSIPHDTLKAVLAYPKSVDAYTQKEYENVLRLVHDLDQFIPELDKKSTWFTRLSHGQRQRISFARALLQKPSWLLLDESTSSLDIEAEEYLYRLIKQQLPQTTLISIAHRDTVAKFHDRILTLNTDKQSKTLHPSQKGHWVNTPASNESEPLSSSADPEIQRVRPAS